MPQNKVNSPVFVCNNSHLSLKHQYIHAWASVLVYFCPLEHHIHSRFLFEYSKYDGKKINLYFTVINYMYIQVYLSAEQPSMRQKSQMLVSVSLPRALADPLN